MCSSNALYCFLAPFLSYSSIENLSKNCLLNFFFALSINKSFSVFCLMIVSSSLMPAVSGTAASVSFADDCFDCPSKLMSSTSMVNISFFYYCSTLTTSSSTCSAFFKNEKNLPFFSAWTSVVVSCSAPEENILSGRTGVLLPLWACWRKAWLKIFSFWLDSSRPLCKKLNLFKASR